VDAIQGILQAAKHPVFVAGGVGGLKDLATLRMVNPTGVVVGSALYSDRITIEQAMEYDERGLGPGA